MEGGGPQLSDNIVNRRGGLEDNLFQACLALRKKLNRVPGFEPWLEDMIAEEEEEDADQTDPVTSMWNLLRRGHPLVALFNATDPPQKAELKCYGPNAETTKVQKQATMDFLNNCIKQLGFDNGECFILRDLYGTDTTGFVKVLKVVNRVLDLADEKGQLYSLANSVDPDANGGKPRTHAENVINEIVTTERDYVQHLQTLQEFQDSLQQTNAIPGDAILNIFMNLNNLLDFQRRFLIRVEQQNLLETDLQNWGQLFHMYREAFRVYEPFIANQTRCNETVGKEWDRIRIAQLPANVQGMVETQSVLLGFLLKPFQRLVKYPMLLEQLIKKGNYDEERVNDLKLGVEATNGILTSANEAVAREARVAAANDLQMSIEDWKGHRMDQFGELLIFGAQTVLKGDGSKEVEREYKVYLFERILICCKDVNPNKAKNKLAGKSNKGKQRLALKGRIWMDTITDILHYSKGTSYYLHIYWRSEVIENFIIRYINKDTRDKWIGLIEKQRRDRLAQQQAALASQQQSQSPHSSVATTNTEATQYPDHQGQSHYMSGTTLNTSTGYLEEDDDDDEVRYTPDTNSMSSNGGLPGSRNASNPSLRGRDRSATGGSGAAPPPAGGRLPPARFPMPETHGANGMPLKIYTGLQTVPQGATTPSEREMVSVFSPSNDSPSSSFRASNTSGFHYPRSSVSTNNSWAAAEHQKHMTAPVGARPSDENLNHARAQRPSLPVTPSNGYTQPARNRAASSSLVQTTDNRRSGGQARTPNDDDPIPPLPLHLAHMRHGPNRSQNNSPTEAYRAARGPPQLQRAPQTFPSSGHDPRIQSSSGHAASRILNQGPVNGEVQLPSQLRIKISFEPQPSHVTIVAPSTIRYQSLVDRIDVKMEKVSTRSISRGTARLKYRDGDGDLITIGNDEDVKSAIEEWVENNENALRSQVLPDFELRWAEVKLQR